MKDLTKYLEFKEIGGRFNFGIKNHAMIGVFLQ